MKVSVIIPAYNAKATVDNTLASLALQTFQDFEVVIVDDGSQDGTADYVRERYPQVRVLTQENAGPAAARNYGVMQSQGEWLAFLDADDAWLPWRLQTQLDLVKKHPEVQMFCGLTTDLVTPIAAPLVTQQASDDFVQFLSVRDFAFSNPVATTAVLLSRRVFQECGGFDAQFRGPEDYDLWMRVATQSKIGKVMYPVSRYRDEIGSLSRHYETFLPEVLRVLDKAYASGGSLYRIGSKRQARAVQFLGAAWTAMESDAKWSGLILIVKSYLSYPLPFEIPGKSRRLRLALLSKALKGLFS